MQSRQPTDVDYRKMERAVGIKAPTAIFRRRIADCIARSCRLSARDPRDVGIATYRTAVRKITDDAERLLAHFTPTADDSEQAWAQEYAVISVLPPPRDEAFLNGLRKIVDAGQLQVDFARASRGRPRNLARENFFDQLIDVYEQTRGRKAGISNNGEYSGPFFRFVTEVLQFVPSLRQTRDALGKALQRHLSQRRKRVVMDIILD